MVLLKNITNFWRTLKVPLINFQNQASIEMVYRNCIIVAGIADNQNPEFKITDTNLYDPVVT